MENVGSPVDWIKHNNIYFVPIIRQRLNFAIAVRRAARHLTLSDNDGIAVEIPLSLLGDLKECIGLLPKASVLTTASSSAGPEEVFPVVPCDAIVEVIRIALEQKLTLACIDQELAPSFFWNRHCLRDDDWLDDEIAMRHGAAAYYRLIEHKLHSLPVRIEPADSWREAHMAESLRQLHLKCRRVLCVCDARHVRAIIGRLGAPAPSWPEEQEALQRYKKFSPSTSLLLQYLDDFPAVVELYDKARAVGNTVDFDKTERLVDVVIRAHIEEFGEPPSIRPMTAFTTLLRNLANSRGRLSPDFEIVSRCVGACFADPMQETTRLRLLEYGEQVRVKSVGGLVSHQEEHDATFSPERKFTSRACNPFHRPYSILTIPVPETSDKDANSTGLWVWPPYSGLVRETMSSLSRHAQEGPTPKKKREIWARPFDGTLGRGVDTRATVRSALQSPPRLFVKRIRNGLAPMRLDELEPVVLILDPKLEGIFRATGFGLLNTYIEQWTYQGQENVVLDDPRLGEYISTVAVGGMVSFITSSCESDTALRKRLGRDIAWRIPRIAEFRVEESGAFPDRCVKYSASRFPWWVTLVLGAAEYAKANVIAVLPDNCELPVAAKRAIEAKNKTICRIPLSTIDDATQRRLRLSINLVGRLEFNVDGDVWVGLVRHFEGRVQQLWN